MSARTPVFVLIPGAWHKPTCYDKIATLLQTQHGLESSAVTLPSTTGRRDATFKDDIDAARAAILHHLDNNRDVVVVVHSYGGMVGNSAIRGLTAPIASGRQSHVIGLVLIASGFTMTGWAFMDLLFGADLPFCRKNTATGFVDLIKPPRGFFYHDLPEAEGEYWAGQLTPQSIPSLYEGSKHAYAGWLDVAATWYLATIEDRGLPIAAQRLQVGVARGCGADVTIVELQTSHSPFLSQPERTVAVLVDALRDFQALAVASPAARALRRQTRAVSLWPSDWWREGFWVGLGEILGRCFRRVRRICRWLHLL